MRFQTKLMLGITALSFATTAFFSVLFLNLARGLAAERLEEKALSLARNLASNSSQAVYNEDLYKQLGPLLKGLLETPDVVAACVRDASGRILARAGADLPAAAEAGWSEGVRGRVFTAAAPVRSRGAGLTPKDSSIGSVRVVLSLEILAARIRRMLVLIGGFGALSLAAGLTLAFFLARRLTRPFIRILEADEAVVRGDLEHSDIPPDDIPADEIGTIIRSRSAMLSSLRRSESESRFFLSGVEQSDDGIFMTGVDGKILFVNAGFEKMTGFSRREAVGAAPKILKSGAHDADFYRAFWKTLASGESWSGTMKNRRKDGTLFDVAQTISPLKDSEGLITGYVSVMRDITQSLKLEADLRQSQKMESVGRLAGGVAHDFNNLLTAINGYAGFVMDALPKDDPKREDVKEILAAGKRAAALTQQLLAFSRRQILTTKIVDLNEIVGGTVRMLKRLIGENIKLEAHLAAHSCMVKVDAGQIDQVIINLAVNARDAMPNGGALTISTKTVAMPEEFFHDRPGLKPGPLVELCVTDTGEGMDEAVRSHLFEPFFTTKEKGKGTGLGLATVHGIIKQSNGEIEIESAPNKGTTFRIYLPETQPTIEEKEKEKEKALGGDETVLLVEDEETVRRLGERILKGNGYTVLTAANGREALKALEIHAKPVDLVITDVVMPGMNGRELAREIVARNMTPRTLYISGYTDDAIVQHGVLEPGLAFLYKPFTPDALLRKMREVLAGPRDQAKA